MGAARRRWHAGACLLATPPRRLNGSSRAAMKFDLEKETSKCGLVPRLGAGKSYCACGVQEAGTTRSDLESIPVLKALGCRIFIKYLKCFRQGPALPLDTVGGRHWITCPASNDIAAADGPLMLAAARKALE